RDLLRQLQVVGGEVDVEGDQGRAGSDEDGALAGIDGGRTEVGHEAAPCQPLYPTPPDLRSFSPVGELAVEEDGEIQLVTDQRGRRERLGARSAVLLLVEVDDRHNIDRADVRVVATV